MNLDDRLVFEARELSGIEERTALVHEGLRALIAREAGRRLAALGGTDASAAAPTHRR